MKLNFTHIEEPQLQFGEDAHICPKTGILLYNTYDFDSAIKKKNILIGVVGISENIEDFVIWIEQCGNLIPSIKSDQPNLFISFCGFNENSGFGSKMIVDEALIRKINDTELKELIKNKDREERIISVADLYYEQVKFLAQNKKPDIIICIIPKSMESKISIKKKRKIDNKIGEEEEVRLETDFRRYLKAKSMHLAVPLQLIKEHSLKSGSNVQDDATRAWNFCTAIYYKANGTPWRLIKDTNKPTVCYVGISFYRSRDRKTIQTSLAQIFDELGNGIILRGTPVQIDKRDRQPHLSINQAHELLKSALKEYKIALENFPARLVIHKTSNFSEDEIEGFKMATNEFHINNTDFVTIMDSKVKLFRDGFYPPFRGSLLQLAKKRYLLYTRGSVEYYETYPGLYIPQPLEIRIVESNESGNQICKEILTLTKMNWNNTQFDGKYPITVACARKVGEILKYLPENEKAQIRYGFYM